MGNKFEKLRWRRRKQEYKKSNRFNKQKQKNSERAADFLADFSTVTVHLLTMSNFIGMAMRSSIYF